MCAKLFFQSMKFQTLHFKESILYMWAFTTKTLVLILRSCFLTKYAHSPNPWRWDQVFMISNPNLINLIGQFWRQTHFWSIRCLRFEFLLKEYFHLFDWCSDNHVCFIACVIHRNVSCVTQFQYTTDTCISFNSFKSNALETVHHVSFVFALNVCSLDKIILIVLETNQFIECKNGLWFKSQSRLKKSMFSIIYFENFSLCMIFQAVVLCLVMNCSKISIQHWTYVLVHST